MSNPNFNVNSSATNLNGAVLNSNSSQFSTSSNQNNNINSNNVNINIVNSLNSNVILQTLKRRTNKVVVPLDERVTLERAYGFTITSNTRISQSCDGTIAYLAGCVIVLYDSNKQTQDFIISPARKTLTTVAFSLDGRMLATGESGHEPRVRVWDVKEKTLISEFAGHKFSIECVYFSPNLNSNLLVSIGSMHDMVVNVWNLKSKFKVASNKISCKVKGVSFSRDGTYFVTVGNRHVKFWYLTTSSLMETVPLKGRAAILGDLKNNYFCDVVCGSDDCSYLTFALTTNGVLCEFNENRCLSRSIDLRTERAYCLYADNHNLFVGCSNGNIHIFMQRNLEFLACLPRPHYLGVDVAQGRDTRHVIEYSKNPELKHPDCVALCYDKYTSRLSAVYNDHSFYVWDIKDLNKVKKLDSHLFHSSCCWALDIYSNNISNNLPNDSFITCSTDNTLRIWSSVSKSSHNSTNTNSNSKLKANIYSKELLKIIYIDNDLSGLCDIDQSINSSSDNSDSQSTTSSTATTTTSQQATQNNINAVTNLPAGSINIESSTSNSNTSNLKLGARCIRVDPFGNHLAAGDRNGNIKIYDLETLEFIGTIEAHDCEILCLQYSQPESGKLLLASSSRDRLIHIFDASNSSYAPLQTIDDHSASITALRFCFNQIEKQLYLISCGNDKSIMFRTLGDQSNNNNSSQCSNSTSTTTATTASNNSTCLSSSTSSSSSSSNQFTRTSYVVEKQTFYDLNIDATKNYINTISQDRMIRTYSIKDGKRLRQFRGSLNEDGYLLKMDTDRNGNLLATSCTDKCVYVWDLNTCECVAYLYGHSEVVTDLKFTSDNQHLITVSGDGCIFVWRLNNLVPNGTNVSTSTTSTTSTTTNTWTSRRAHSLSGSQPSGLIPANPINHLSHPQFKTQQSLDTIFDDNECLPTWARNKLININNSPSIPSKSNSTSFESNQITPSNNLANSNSNDQPARRSRAVWGPPVLNTSFAVMMESEMNSLITNSMHDPHSNNNNDTLTYEDKVEVFENDVDAIANEIIQFPSPCVDKDFFHVKQVRLTSCDLTNRRMSWMGGAQNDDDQKDKLNNEVDDDVLVAPGESSPNHHQTKSPITNSNYSINNRLSSTVLNSGNLTFRKDENESIIPHSSSPQFEFNSDFSKILNPSSPTSCVRDRTSSQSNLIDSIMKLECDMENSIRRQSLSARYLMKTQQQQLNQSSSQQQSQTQTTTPNQSPTKPENLTLSSNSPATKVDFDCGSSVNLACANEQLESTSQTAKISPQFSLSSAQIAADLLKLRRKSVILNNLTSNLSSGTNSQSSQQLYNHHTESSLSKTKPRSSNAQNPTTSTSTSTSTTTTTTTTTATATTNQNNQQTFQNQLKRSPSVSSLSNESRSSINGKSQNDLKIPNTNKSTSAKSSPNKQNTLQMNPLQTTTTTTTTATSTSTNSNPHNNHSTNPGAQEDSNLKKAVSMITLFSNQTNKSLPKCSNSTTNNNQKTIATTTNSNSNTSSNNNNINNNNNNNNNNLLPPKTMRQIKQRSAERQLTSSSILAHTQSSSNRQSVSNTSASSSSSSSSSNPSTFIEQNKHLRKLSSSIQNIHHQQQHQPLIPSSNSQNLLSATNLPPQAPRSSSKSPQFQLSPTKSNRLSHSNSSQNQLANSLASLNNNQSKTKTKRSSDTIMQQQKILPSEIMILEQGSGAGGSCVGGGMSSSKQIDTDQMSSSSSSSSSSSQNGDFIIDSNNNANNNLLSNQQSDNDDTNNNLQSGQFQISSNSLTSSSSSSCSIFEPNPMSNLGCDGDDNKTNSNQENLNRSNEIEMSLNNSFNSNNNNNNNNTSSTTLSPTSTCGQSSSHSNSLTNPNLSGFKKPITFATLAAANLSNQINISPSNGNTNNLTSPTSTHSSKLSSSSSSLHTHLSHLNLNCHQHHLSNDKIESILYEFKQNMYILDLIYNQVSKNMEEFKKFQQTSASLIQQSSSCNSMQPPSPQALQLIQTFNTSIHSIVKQFKTLLNNGPTTTPTTTTTTASVTTSTTTTTTNTASQSPINENCLNKLDADLEII